MKTKPYLFCPLASGPIVGGIMAKTIMREGGIAAVRKAWIDPILGDEQLGGVVLYHALGRPADQSMYFDQYLLAKGQPYINYSRLHGDLSKLVKDAGVPVWCYVGHMQSPTMIAERDDVNRWISRATDSITWLADTGAGIIVDAAVALPIGGREEHFLHTLKASGMPVGVENAPDGVAQSRWDGFAKLSSWDARREWAMKTPDTKGECILYLQHGPYTADHVAAAVRECGDAGHHLGVRPWEWTGWR